MFMFGLRGSHSSCIDGQTYANLDASSTPYRCTFEHMIRSEQDRQRIASRMRFVRGASSLTRRGIS